MSDDVYVGRVLNFTGNRGDEKMRSEPITIFVAGLQVVHIPSFDTSVLFTSSSLAPNQYYSMDPFRTNFLNHTEEILKKKPSAKALLELLGLATPGLTRRDVEKKPTSAFRVLQARLHPDKHPQASDRATRLFKEVKLFYDECCEPSSSPSRGNHDSFRSSLLPFEFNANMSKWPHMAYDQPLLDNDSLSDEKIASLIAYQCINARAAIAHGKHVTRRFTSEQVLATFQEQPFDVEAIFDAWGGCKTLDGDGIIQDIKQEIFEHGPVVSTSFSFSHNDGYFFPHLKNLVTQKAILIVGWKATEVGEVWLVQPLVTPTSAHGQNPQAHPIPIAIGQFGINEVCLAPAENFENRAWEEGPYVDISFSPETSPVWRTWPGVQAPITTEQYVELTKELGRISFGPKEAIPAVTVRDKDKVARSERARIEYFEWREETKEMFVSVIFI